MTGVAVRSRRRGQPVIVLAAIAVGWIGLRAATWEQPLSEGRGLARPDSPRRVLPAHGVPPKPYRDAGAFKERGEGADDFAGAEVGGRAYPVTPPPGPAGVDQRAHGLAGDTVSGPAPEWPPARRVDDVRTGAEMPLPSDRRQNPRRIAAPARRWHVDAWYAWRSGSGQPRTAAGGPRAPAYGGTQGGFVLRRDLGEGDRRPQAYLRATHAPSNPAQADLAAGFGFRPLARVPVRLQAEARVTRTGSRTEMRPAAAAITELAAYELPLAFRAEAYAQGGYVGGREATAFVDGQIRLDRPVVSLGGAELRAGGGAWGGAQKYAARLDVGPGLTLDLRGAGIPARVSLDYRVRAAGRARPSNGPAVTLSTGF